MAMTLRVVVPPHTLIAHWLTMLRNESTPASLYSTGLEELGRWLTYEALRDWLPYRQEKVTTNLCSTEGQVIESSVPILAIPFLPGGLELWQGARKVLPNAHLCLKGVPNFIEENAGIVLLLDQIDTGGRLVEALSVLKKKNVDTRRIRVVTALASSPGLVRTGEENPELNIFTACIDPELTENGEIKPGIGNPSLRINTRT